MNGTVVALCICPAAGQPMQEVKEKSKQSPEQGSRETGMRPARGPFNKGDPSRRPVTFINGLFFKGSGYEFVESRRNIVTMGVELMWLIGREFSVGEARFYGVKYCDPCERPRKLAGKTASFREAFLDRGGLIAEIVQSGVIRTGDSVVPPAKGY